VWKTRRPGGAPAPEAGPSPGTYAKFIGTT